MKKVSAIASVYNCIKYLPGFLENVAAQTIRDQLEIVLVHNQPTDAELGIVQDFQTRYPGLITHIIVPLEKLAVSTNRAIRAAAGEYVCIWNVDDLRTPNSVEMMTKVLDDHPETGFTYGDFIIVYQWQEKVGKYYKVPEFKKEEFVRNMFLGPFYMWRKTLCEKIGYWDEQFKSAGDFDYAVRLAIESKGKKTEGLLGYYLDEGLGLSTAKIAWPRIERVMIELRYGIYRKLDFWYLFRVKGYRLSSLLQDGQWVPIDKAAPGYKQFEDSRWWVVMAIIRYPFWLMRLFVRPFVRKYL
jgi:glycosyltransferase involved in cell wall biosynthesis